MQTNSKQEVSEQKQGGRSKGVSRTPAEQALRLIKILQFSVNSVILLRRNPSVQTKVDWYGSDSGEWSVWPDDERHALLDRCKHDIQACRDTIQRIQIQPGQLEEKVLEVKHDVDRTLLRLDRFAPLMYEDGRIDSACLQKCNELSDQLEEAFVLLQSLIDQRLSASADDTQTLTIADLAVNEIKMAYPNWITSGQIGKKIDKNAKSVRSALSQFAKTLPGGPPWESDTSGKPLGYRWRSA